MGGKVLLFLTWIPRPPHIWTTRVLSSPGLTFFMRLPGPIDGKNAFDDMLSAAESVASFLGGELRDERRSVLTRQTTDHMRERIMEFRRQSQLAASKAR